VRLACCRSTAQPLAASGGGRRSGFTVNAGAGLVTALRACGSAGGSVAKGMKKISYRGYRFPPEIIQQAIWLYLRFTLSLRDVEDLLAERGIMVSYETVRRCAALRTHRRATPFAWQPIVAAIVPINCYRTAKATTSLKCRDNAQSWERLDGFVMGER
jgi:hypothetical protein